MSSVSRDQIEFGWWNRNLQGPAHSFKFLTVKKIQLVQRMAGVSIARCRNLSLLRGSHEGGVVFLM